ncbi:MAG: VWA-like domain-containing protein [Sulfuricellaceae bacterium]
MSNTETKLAAARTRLILDKPFLGALVLRLPLTAADPKWCPTTATDARRFYYNPAYIDTLNLAQTQFMLAHEALHCALSHFARRNHRIKQRWDVACDFAINPLLVKDGLKPPPGALLLEVFDGLSAEEIYSALNDNNTDEPLDKHLYDGDEGDGGSGQSNELPAGGGSGLESGKTDAGHGAGDPKHSQGNAPPPLSARERNELSSRWRQYLASAAQAALQAGKLSGAMARLVEHLLQPQLPWRMLLARYMTLSARDDYTYLRPSRREGAMIFPALRSAQLEVTVALDVSGSVSDRDIGEFLAEIDALKSQIRARITLLACDATLSADSPWLFEPWDTLQAPRQFTGGGGTRFAPVFEWIKNQSTRPDLLLYFTDAKGDFPPVEPDYSVIWLVKGNAPSPWGQRIQLN